MTTNVVRLPVEHVSPSVEASEWVRDLISTLPPLMSPRTLSELTEYSEATLSRWRKTWPAGDRVGPAFSTPLGTNSIRYSRLDVAEWLAESHVKEGAR